MIMSLGSRFVMGDLNTYHEQMLDNIFVKQFVIFCMFFVGCRSVEISLALTIAFDICVYGLFNFSHKYTLIPKRLIANTEVSMDDYKRAKKIVDVFEHGQKKSLGRCEKQIADYKRAVRKVT